MDDHEIARRLVLVREIATPIRQALNRILEVGADRIKGVDDDCVGMV
jgi:hypothetical protein